MWCTSLSSLAPNSSNHGGMLFVATNSLIHHAWESSHLHYVGRKRCVLKRVHCERKTKQQIKCSHCLWVRWRTVNGKHLSVSEQGFRQQSEQKVNWEKNHNFIESPHDEDEVVSSFPRLRMNFVIEYIFWSTLAHDAKVLKDSKSLLKSYSWLLQWPWRDGREHRLPQEHEK